jgi:hypothetical protein
MNLSREILNKLSKADLIDLVLQLQVSTPEVIRDNRIIVIDENWGDDERFTKLISLNGMRFRLLYNNRNGVPLGFDSRFKAEIEAADKSWNPALGKKMLILKRYLMWLVRSKGLRMLKSYSWISRLNYLNYMLRNICTIGRYCNGN